jgi:hypothetical protein
MQDSSGTIQKALEINLDPSKYGTIAEIGAGQEVARFFFRAGGAAGTVAKTISAYDMKFSDAIYGQEEDRRYVSRSRLLKMLAHEYNLLIERISDARPKNTTFFVFSDTVAARAYKSKGECHGWLGVRLQLYPKAEPSDIILHVRLLDEENYLQQEALGILGVNLMYGAFYHFKTPEKLIESLIDAIGPHRIEVDTIQFLGPYFEDLDNRLLALHLVKAGLTNAVLFSPAGEVQQPAEVMRKKSVLVIRGSFRPVTHVNLDMIRCGTAKFEEEPGVRGGAIVTLAEITTAKLVAGDVIDPRDFLARVDMLNALGFNVLISNYVRFFRLREYLSRYTQRPIGIVLGVDNILDIFDEKYYEGVEGGILEAFGKLFPGQSKMYVYPKLEQKPGLITADTLEVPKHLRHLYLHLKENGFIEALEGADESKMAHFSRDILKKLKRGEDGWQEGVPESVAQAIVTKRLFGYDSE